jgi:opacity protein-like surface antigen
VQESSFFVKLLGLVDFRRTTRMRLLYVSPALLLAAFCSIPPARAQSSFDLNIGGGSAWAGSNGQGLETNQESLNFGGTCTPGLAGDTTCVKNPSLSGFFLGFGLDVMLTKKYGLGFEGSFQPSRPDYGPFQYRQSFYDVYGIFSPISTKRAQLKISGGIGAARTSFAESETACVGNACTTETVPTGINASHFQVHVGVGLELFVTDHIFVRPELDYHYIVNFNQEFGTNSVPQAMVWVGYSFGEH